MKPWKDLVKVLMTVFTVLGALRSFGQQGPQFTQFMFNNLAINPAYAGADEAPSLTVVNRSQWIGIENAPSTQSLSAHTLMLDRVGLGLTIIHDQIGVHKTTNAMANYAYHLRAGNRSYISMGVQAGVTNFKSDYPSLAAAGNDPKTFNYVSGTKFDFGAGIYFRSPRMDLGLSAPGFLSRQVYLNDTLSIRFRNADLLAYGRYRFRLDDSFTTEPAILIKYFPGLSLSYDVNWSIIYKGVLTGGLSYRRNESVDFMIKLQLTPRLQFGYAYDYPVRNAVILHSPSHEVMAHYVFRKAHKNIASPR